MVYLMSPTRERGAIRFLSKNYFLQSHYKQITRFVQVVFMDLLASAVICRNFVGIFDSELYLNSSYEKATGCLSTGWQVLVEMLVYSSMSPYFSRLSAVLQEKSHVFSHCFRGVHIGLNLHQIPLNTRPDYQLHPTPSCRTHQYTYLMWYGCLYVPASL